MFALYDGAAFRTICAGSIFRSLHPTASETSPLGPAAAVQHTQAGQMKAMRGAAGHMT